MIEKGKISAVQLGAMMHPTVAATGILLVPAITSIHAERDLWLSPIWASLIGFLIVYVMYALNKLYPKQTLIQYTEEILGKVIGKFVGCLFLLFYLHITSIIFREYAEFVISNFLIRTPLLVIVGSLALVCSFAVYGGIEVIARAAQLFVPVVVFFLVMLFIFLIPELDTSNMLPVMEKGVGPSLLGSVVIMAWFSEYALISFLLPLLKDRNKVVKWGFISVLSVMGVLVITNITALLLFGNITGKLTYPVLSAGSYISIADFFEHVESIVGAIWVTGTFLKISVFYYTIVLGTSQWLKLSDYRPVVLPIGFILVITSIWTASSLEGLAHFLGTIAPFYMFFFQVMIPVSLLAVGKIQHKVSGRSKG